MKWRTSSFGRVERIDMSPEDIWTPGVKTSPE